MIDRAQAIPDERLLLAAERASLSTYMHARNLPLFGSLSATMRLCMYILSLYVLLVQKPRVALTGLACAEPVAGQIISSAASAVCIN
jgi:hypothetical protein